MLQLNPNAKNELFSGDFEPEDVLSDHKSLFGNGGGDGFNGMIIASCFFFVSKIFFDMFCSDKRQDSQRLLQSSDASIHEATRSLYEAEQTGMHVMVNLHEQRSVMERFKDRLQGVCALCG